jgi:beta-glucosidase
MIGTNNFGLHNDKPADVANGVKAIVETLQKKVPSAKVLLLGVFPRGQKPENDFRKRITTLNEEISKLQDSKKVVYMDIKETFLDKNGNLPKELMPDYLHLSEKGYFLWAEAIEPTVKKMLAD